MPFDKKIPCLTNYQEKRSFPWPLVLEITANFIPYCLTVQGALFIVRTQGGGGLKKTQILLSTPIC